MPFSLLTRYLHKTLSTPINVFVLGHFVIFVESLKCTFTTSSTRSVRESSSRRLNVFWCIIKSKHQHHHQGGNWMYYRASSSHHITVASSGNWILWWFFILLMSLIFIIDHFFLINFISPRKNRSGTVSNVFCNKKQKRRWTLWKVVDKEW